MGILTDGLRGHPDLTVSGDTERTVVQEALEVASGSWERAVSARFLDFESYIRERNPSLLDFEHIPMLIRVIEKLLSGAEPRLMIFAPPRYLKSEICSRLLPGYELTQRPRNHVGLVSHSSSLALDLSESARDNYANAGGYLKPGTEAKSRWATAADGRMWASGLSGRFMGKGYHLGIVDDPVDPEQAISLSYQLRFERFWPAKFLSRQEPNARILFIMQRVGVEDPADFLFRREVGEGTEEAPEHWHVCALDEIHSDEPLGRWKGPRGLPETCTLEPDYRKVGQVLAPSRFSQEQVEKIHRTSASFVTQTQRQQRPLKPQGDFWEEKWFENHTYKTLPNNAYNGGKDWDTAYGEDPELAASGYVESYRGPGDPGQFPIFIESVDWDWKEFPELIQWMQSVPGPHYIEAKATGKSAVQALKAQDIQAQEVQVKGNKLMRASAAQPVVANRRVFVNENCIHHLLNGDRQGLLRVTAEALMRDEGGLDVNDMFVQAIHRHLKLGKKTKGTADFR